MDQFHHVSAAFLELEKGLVLMFCLYTSVLFYRFSAHIVTELLEV